MSVKFYVVEVREDTWRYTVEAESAEQAVAKVRDGKEVPFGSGKLIEEGTTKYIHVEDPATGEIVFEEDCT